MARRFGLIYTIFSVVVLIVLATLVLARLGTARTLNLQEAEASFRRVQDDLQDAVAEAQRTAAARALEPADEGALIQRALADTIRQYAQLVPQARAIVAFEPGTGLRYLWSADAGLIASPTHAFESFRGFPEYALSDVTHVRLRDPVSLPDAPEAYLDAVYRVLTFADAYPPLRDSLISLLAFAILTVAVAIIAGRESGPERERPAGNGPAPEPAPTRNPQPAQDPAAQSDPRSRRGRRADAHQRGAVPADRADQPDTAREPTPQSPAPQAGPETHDGGHASHEELILEEIALEELATDPGEPGSLVNPVSGLSHREHLERRLGLELERAAYNDQDLTCIIIRFPTLGGPDDYVERARQVISTFQFEDLCFEYDENSFCVILPNTDLPQGIRQAEAFRTRHGSAILGLSARNGRLVEAHRVLVEADRSLSHAATEPGGVVGFRPDPRKYRQYVTQQLGQSE